MTVKAANHRSTNRVIDVLEFFSTNSGEYTLTEICKTIGAPKSSMFPILHTLCERQYLSYDEQTSKYTISNMAFVIGGSFLNRFDFMKQVEEEMHNVVNSCRETCQFGTLVDGEVLYLKKVDSTEPIHMISIVGRRRPAYATGLGKALITDYELTDLKKLFPDGLKPLTPHTITDYNELENQLQKAREEGVTYEVEESMPYIRCISIPLRKGNKIVAALSVAVPTFRYTNEQGKLIKRLLFEASSKIEKWLEYSSVDFTFIV